jgi:hypothetical protein
MSEVKRELIQLPAAERKRKVVPPSQVLAGRLLWKQEGSEWIKLGTITKDSSFFSHWDPVRHVEYTDGKTSAFVNLKEDNVKAYGVEKPKSVHAEKQLADPESDEPADLESDELVD